jgi:hypothetical protein
VHEIKRRLPGHRPQAGETLQPLGQDLTGRFLLIVEALRRREAEEDWGKEKWR